MARGIQTELIYLAKKTDILSRIENGTITKEEVFDTVAKTCEMDICHGISEKAYYRIFDTDRGTWKTLTLKGWKTKFNHAINGTGPFSAENMRIQRAIRMREKDRDI